MKKEFNLKSFIVDSFWNPMLYRPNASEIMDQHAAVGSPSNVVVSALMTHLMMNRENCQKNNLVFGGLWTAVIGGLCLFTGSVGVISGVFLAHSGFKLLAGVEKFGPVKNPLAPGLDRSNDFKRMNSLVNKHYAKRLK